MKLVTAEQTIETNMDLNDDRIVNMRMSAHAVQIMSSQIYTDPKLAIVREISTNCLDAHIKNGNPEQPFDVSLPNRLSPHMSFRDYGTGLPDEAVYDLFMTYFGSDKTHTNSMIGGLGLGSKSPASYTDHYTVTSYYNGTETLFTVYKDEQGLLKVNRVSSKPTDEPNGLNVQIPIKEQDYGTFIRNAQRVYKYFDIKPNIINDTEFDFIYSNYKVPVIDRYEPIPEYENDHFVLKNPFGDGDIAVISTPDNTSKVVQGTVAYSLHNLPESLSESARRFYKQWGNYIIYAPVGTFDIAASRENLNYTNPTIERLDKLADIFIESQLTYYQKQYRSLTTLKDYAEYAKSVTTSRLLAVFSEHPTVQRLNNIEVLGRKIHRLSSDSVMNAIDEAYVPTFKDNPVTIYMAKTGKSTPFEDPISHVISMIRHNYKFIILEDNQKRINHLSEYYKSQGVSIDRLAYLRLGKQGNALLQVIDEFELILNTLPYLSPKEMPKEVIDSLAQPKSTAKYWHVSSKDGYSRSRTLQQILETNPIVLLEEAGSIYTPPNLIREINAMYKASDFKFTNDKERLAFKELVVIRVPTSHTRVIAYIKSKYPNTITPTELYNFGFIRQVISRALACRFINELENSAYELEKFIAISSSEDQTMAPAFTRFKEQSARLSDIKNTEACNRLNQFYSNYRSVCTASNCELQHPIVHEVVINSYVDTRNELFNVHPVVEKIANSDYYTSESIYRDFAFETINNLLLEKENNNDQTNPVHQI